MLPDANGRFNVVEGADDPAQRLDWCERVEWRNSVNVLANGGERGGVEDVNVFELGNEEGIGRWSRLR